MLSDRLFYEIGLFSKLKENNEEISELRIINDNPLSFSLVLHIKNFDYHFEVIFPRFFPFQPIIVKNMEERRLSKHEYNDKTMCLKWGIDNWNENVTIKNIILNLIELISVENPFGDEHGKAESGDVFTLAQRMGQHGDNLLLSFEVLDSFKRKRGVAEVLKKRTSETTLFCFSKVGNKRLNPIFNSKEKMKITYWKLNDLNKIKITTQDIEGKYLGKNNYCFIFERLDNKVRGIFVGKEFYKKRVVNSNPVEQRESFLEEDVYIYSTVNILFVDKEIKKRINIDEKILEKKIAILGLGSIGSRVLMDLARAGFKKFMLCDGDVFMPNNVIRHELTNKDIGELKIVALAEKIKSDINKDVNFEFYAFALNGQESTNHTNRMLEGLSTCELIIDCTADSNIIFSLNQIVMDKDLNYVSGSVLNGGVGNVLINRKKGSELSLIDIVESQKKFFEINSFDFSRSHDYFGKIGDTEYVATMSDCSIIAGLIGKNAINMLKNQENEFLKYDIYVMSTSNEFLDESYACYPLIANKRDYTPKKLSQNMIMIGKRYYENNYSRRNSG